MNTKLSKKNIGRFLSENLIYVILVAMIIMLTILKGTLFFSFKNFSNIIRQVSVNGIISVGMTMVIVCGCIDLSIGSQAGLAGMLCGLLATKGVPLILCILAPMCVSVIVGILNGFFSQYFKLPPFICTLAMQQMLRGIVYVLTQGQPVFDFEKSYLVIGQGYFLKIPVQIWIMLAVAFIFYLVLQRTRFGRHVYYTGSNPDAATASGISTYKVRTLVYVLSGILASLAGAVLTMRVGSAMPYGGEGYEQDAIAATVIGGTSMSGGKGTIWGAIFGAFMLGVINNGMNYLGVDQYWQRFFKGFVILFAVVMDARKTIMRNKS